MASSRTASYPVATSGIARSRPFSLTTGLTEHNLSHITRLGSTQIDNVPLEPPKTREAEEAELALAMEMSLAEVKRECGCT